MFISKKHPSHKLWFYLPLSFLFLLIGVLLLLPTVIKKVVNDRLEKESPYFSFHIRGIDLNYFKGLYSVVGITGTIKSNQEKFLKIQKVSASVPWKDLFKGQIEADVMINKMNLSTSQVLLDNAKAEGERLKNKMKPTVAKEDTKSRLHVNSFRLLNSTITIHDFLSFKGPETREISNINILAFNLTPTPSRPLTPFKLNAEIFGPAPLETIGMANIMTSPPLLDTNTIMRGFDIQTINPFILERVKAFVRKGKLDLYAEVKSEGEAIQGYVKPFISKFRMDRPKGGFNFTGAAAKTGGNLVKILLTDSEAKTLATEIPFTYSHEKLDLEIIPVLTRAVEHKVKQNIQPGIEDKIGEKGLGVGPATRQAQEEK